MPNFIIGKIIILAVIVFLAFLFIETRSGSVKVYDCGMTEWHPDIPKEVRDECRRIYIDELKKQNIDKRTIST